MSILRDFGLPELLIILVIIVILRSGPHWQSGW